ncbi:type VI secretion system-associated protein TagF [Variovorax sp. J22R133]|uniref:type VI secretion system-associated protein TagF n=1 Tax=Variovorax brevis TaxID=3053503 RepID=UPI002576F8D8|nr:type VI secretion system-associated protein TagF [Variovorax sp. J22R133]MDM0112100.1 type VI secretion system-associated protein TagF [Variovorax sp. J22R133]
MLRKIIESNLVTPPAIWGKLPAHSDFVRHGMRHGESEGWQPWLAQLGRAAANDEEGDSPAVLPSAFVLPPGTLSFASKRFVVGVITPSSDGVGRRHPLLVYHLAHPRWVQRHFESHVRQPRDWLFWLARAIARHTNEVNISDMPSLRRTVNELWSLHAPAWTELWAGHKVEGRPASPPIADNSGALVDRWAGPASAADLAGRLHGVRHLPWADWPECLHRPHRHGVFWQQDAQGRFVNAANRLQRLWGES